MRSVTKVVVLGAVLALAAATGLTAIYVPQVAIYVPILAVGLALALQKYLASMAAYFVITQSRIYGIGDRIRIGTLKGDVRRVGLLHTILEEVGEDEKLGGELTGRLLHVPNLVILDQAVLNYSKDYSDRQGPFSSDYMFDEVRIPITLDSNTQAATELLEGIMKGEDETYINEALQIFRDGYPRFLEEAMSGPRVLVYVEPQRIWIKGKFVAPVRGRNEMKSRILLQFFQRAKAQSDIKLA